MKKTDTDVACREQIIVHRNRRHGDVAADLGAALGNLELRRADPARRHLGAGGVVERDFPEFRKLQHVVLYDAVLLPRRQVGVFEVARQRVKDLDVGVDTQ